MAELWVFNHKVQNEVEETGKLYFSVHLHKYLIIYFLSNLKLGLIPRISSVENLCSKKDLDEYHRYHCIEIASEVGPHILPEVCARLIVSMSARIHNGAVRKYQFQQDSIGAFATC